MYIIRLVAEERNRAQNQNVDITSSWNIKDVSVEAGKHPFKSMHGSARQNSFEHNSITQLNRVQELICNCLYSRFS